MLVTAAPSLEGTFSLHKREGSVQFKLIYIFYHSVLNLNLFIFLSVQFKFFYLKAGLRILSYFLNCTPNKG